MIFFTDFPRKAGDISPFGKNQTPFKGKKSYIYIYMCSPILWRHVCFRIFFNTHPTEHHWYSQLWVLQWCLCTFRLRRRNLKPMDLQGGRCTLPETNRTSPFLPLKIGWIPKGNEKVFQSSIFRGENVSFREGTPCKSSFSDYKWNSGLVRILWCLHLCIQGVCSKKTHEIGRGDYRTFRLPKSWVGT